MNAVELPQGVVGVDQKDLIQVTIQNRVRLFRVGPDQRLQRNQMPQADKGLCEKKILLLAVHSILSLDIPVLLDQSGNAVNGRNRVPCAEAGGTGHLRFDDPAVSIEQGDGSPQLSRADQHIQKHQSVHLPMKQGEGSW